MKKRVFIWLISILILAGLYWVPGYVESHVPAIYYVTPERQSYENSIFCSGTIQSAMVQEIYFSTPMVAKEVKVAVGDVVAPGDVLIQVDGKASRQLQAQGLELLKGLGTSTTSVQSPVPTQETDWMALASLYGVSAAISPFSGSGAGASASSNVLQAFLSQSQSATAAVDSAAQKIIAEPVHQEITAPMQGIVTQVNLAEQSVASIGQPVLTLADNQNYLVMAAVNEADVGKVGINDKAKITGVGFSGRQYQGYVSKIYPTARKALSGTTMETVVDVEIVVLNSDRRLKPGFSAKVEIFTDQAYDMLTIPYEAVRQDEENNEYVFVYEDGRLKKQLVQTGQEMTKHVEIVSGISSDSVIIYNPENLEAEGKAIHIRGRANVN